MINPKILKNILDKKSGSSIFTVKSLKTGNEFTFKIKKSIFNNKHYIHVYVEIGYLKFTRLGCYFNGRIFNKKKSTNTIACKAIAFILQKVENNDFSYLEENIEIMHTGKCILCSRTLTDSDSIKRGVGPTCAKK